MKHLILTIIIALVSTVGASAQVSFYEACKANKDFETVYIGKAMLKMIKGKELKINGMDLNPLVDKIDAIIVVNTEKKNAGKQLRALAGEFSTTKGYEIMVDTKNNDEQMSILYKNTGKNKNEYVIKADDKLVSETSVIIITGSLTPEDIIKLKHVKL